MAAVIVITRDKVQVEKLAVSTPRFTIGRSKSCELPLNDAIMSRQHCIISESGNGYTIEDNGSRNGTEVNGSHITGQTPLSDGDKIVLGPFELTFYSTGGEAIIKSEDEMDDDAATRFAGADDVDQVVKKQDKSKPVSADAIVRIEVVSGHLKGTTYKGWHGDLIIGRASENDVILPDDASSGQHARIFKDSSGANYVEDLGSINGTFVDNVRIRDRKPLKNGTKIRIGTTVMEYHETDPKKQKAMRRKITIAAVVVVCVLVLAKILTPEDPTPNHLARGAECLSRGEYEEAIVAYEDALNSSPDNSSAKAGISEAKSQKEARKLLDEASERAKVEDYLGAEELLHRVLRLHDQNEETKELRAVIDKIRESKIAADAQNWTDAIRLIEKALETYPDSEVLQTGLDRAASEQEAQEGLKGAAEFLEAKSYTKAGDLLRGIKETSAYYEEARIKRALLEKLEKAERSYVAALEAYRGGDEAAAFDYISSGLASIPDYKDLVKLRTDIALVSPLKKKLESSEALLSSSNVDEMRQMIKDCDAAMSFRIKSEEVAQVSKQAAEFADKLRDRMKELSKEASFAAHKAEARGNKQEALQQFNIAAAADPGNGAAAEAIARLRKILDPLVKEHFQQAMVHEELQQIDLAIEEYEEVIRTAIPGDSYYKRAKVRLKRLK